MVVIARVGVALLGALFLVIGAGLIFNTTDAAADLGLPNMMAAGYGTVRADIAGFFLGGGLISVVASLRKDGSLLWPVQLLVLLALLGRVFTLAVDGPVAAGLTSMGVEVAILVLLLWAKRVWQQAPL
jgi:hypothetical protein